MNHLPEMEKQQRDQLMFSAIKQLNNTTLYRPCEVAAFIFHPNSDKNAYQQFTRLLRERIKYKSEPDRKVGRRAAWYGATWLMLLPPEMRINPSQRWLAKAPSPTEVTDKKKVSTPDLHQDGHPDSDIDPPSEKDYMEISGDPMALSFSVAPMVPQKRGLRRATADFLMDRFPSAFYLLSRKPGSGPWDYRRPDVGIHPFRPGQWTVFNAPGLFVNTIHPSGLFQYIYPFWRERRANGKVRAKGKTRANGKVRPKWKIQSWERHYLDAYGYCCRNQFREAMVLIETVMSPLHSSELRSFFRAIGGVMRIFETLQRLHYQPDPAWYRRQLIKGWGELCEFSYYQDDPRVRLRFLNTVMEAALCAGHPSSALEFDTLRHDLFDDDMDDLLKADPLDGALSLGVTFAWHELSLAASHNPGFPTFRQDPGPLLDAVEVFEREGLDDTAFFYKSMAVRLMDPKKTLKKDGPTFFEYLTQLQDEGKTKRYWWPLFRLTHSWNMAARGLSESDQVVNVELSDLRHWPNPLQRFYIYNLFHMLRAHHSNDQD